MFSPSLKERGEDTLVYATPLGFRIVFLIIAAFIVFSVITASEGPLFSRFNGVSVTIILICLLAALYLERWTFDRQANSFERNVGVLFFYSRKSVPLDSLRKVILYEPGLKYAEQPAYSRWMTRRAAMVSVVDQNGTFYKLDMVKGGAVNQGRRIAETLSIFCDIPLEDNTESLNKDLM